MRIKETDCPACHSAKNNLLGKPEVKGFPLLSHLQVSLAVSIVSCLKCGLIYCDPMPFWENEDVRVLYSQDYFIDVTETWELQQQKGIPEAILNYLSPFLPSEKSIRFLDIGAGQGHTSIAGMQRGWVVEAIDFSPELVDYLNKSGIKAYLGRLEELDLGKSKYDAAVMNSVLEHLPSIEAFMYHLSSVVRHGGVVFCGVPNERSFYKRYLAFTLWLKNKAKPFTPYPSPFQNPYHLIGFSKDSLNALFKRYGFEPLLIEAVGGREQLSKYSVIDKSLRSSLMDRVHWIVLALGELIHDGIYISSVFKKVGSG